MSEDKTQVIKNYLQKIKSANKESTKKEIFKDLLNRLYFHSKEILEIIDSISAGAEHTIVNIPRKDKFHTGRADTLYNKVIIEFENDLRRTLSHAKRQLAGYLLGQFHSGQGYNFTLIASDFINWKVFSPDISQLEILESLNEEELKLNEVPSASFTLTEDNLEDFYYWLDRMLFRETRQKATLQSIEQAFGHQSNVFIESFRIMIKHFQDIKKFGEIQVAYEQWNKFLSIAYGSFNGTEEQFIIHTYLSIFAKMLAYSVLSGDEYIDEDEMKGIIDGSVFTRFNIRNFVEDDFFSWVKKDRSIRALSEVFRIIAQEISSFDFEGVEEDILKGVYQELIDLDTRHALGEYYTPDWLCTRIMDELKLEEKDKILDPSCGSGSFLRAAIHKIKQLYPQRSAYEISEQVYGIDIHPLSVQIAKTTVLLALGKDIINSSRPVHLNIILANTLLAPEGVRNLFGKNFKLKIDEQEFSLNTQVLDDIDLFDKALDLCEELAEQTIHQKSETLEDFAQILKNNFPDKSFNGNITQGFYNIYLGLKKVKERGRNSIWRFILQNSYKPYFLHKKFDYVIGNPPWFTYSSIKNEEYQDILNNLAQEYNVKPTRVANFPHLEIAAIFLAHSVNYFLKDKGKLAFVLPRSFLYADHHEPIRAGMVKGVEITGIWDLEQVSPLFNIPSCVFFAHRKGENKKSKPVSGVKGLIFKGRLPLHNSKWQLAKDRVSELPVRWYYVRQGNSSALVNRRPVSNKKQVKINPYKEQFKQGATIVPRTFYFVELDQDRPVDFNDRILNLRTPKDILAEAKKPWKIPFRGQVNSQFLFCTALAKNILPFALYKPYYVVLPITIEQEPDSDVKVINVHSHVEIRRMGYLYTSRWFMNVENIWNIHKTERNKNISSWEYLDWQNKLSSQNLNARYLVLYTASAKDANAVVLDREKLKQEKDYQGLEFIVESTSYVYYTNSLQEAYYLTGILNSQAINLKIKDFQAKGLFGPRHVHKKILDVYFPLFNPEDKKHIEVASISEKLHSKAEQFLRNNPPSVELTPYHLGRLRLSIKEYLAPSLKQLEQAVEKLLD